MKLMNKEHGYLNFLAVFALVLLSVFVLSFMGLSQTQFQSSKLLSKTIPNISTAESASVFAIHRVQSILKDEVGRAISEGNPSPFATFSFNEGCNPTNLTGFTDQTSKVSLETCLDEIETDDNTRRFKIKTTSTLGSEPDSLKSVVEVIVSFEEDAVNNGNISYSILKWTGR